MGNPFGPHTLVDSMDSNQLEAIIKDYIVPEQPNWCNVSAAARLREGMQHVQAIRMRAPKVGVIFRNMGTDMLRDDGVWKVIKPKDWFDLWVAPHLAWLQEWKPVLMTDNESVESGDALEAYAVWMAEVLKLASKVNVKLAVGRFPAGNPEFGQYSRLLPMFRALETYGGLWSPNEYFGQTPELSNSLPGRFYEGLKVCDQFDIKRPKVVIGEYAVTYARKIVVDGREVIILDPQKGFSHSWIGWSDAQHFNACEFHYTNWIKPHGADVCVFAEGRQAPYETYAVGRDFWKLAGQYPDTVTPTEPTIPTVPQETDVEGGILDGDARWVQAKIKPAKAGQNINIRIKPSTTNNNPVAALSSEVTGYIAVDPAWGDWAQIRYPKAGGGRIYGWISKPLVTWVPMERLITLTMPMTTYEALRLKISMTEEQLQAIRKTLEESIDV